MTKDLTASTSTIPPTAVDSRARCVSDRIGRLQVSAYSEGMRRWFDVPLNEAHEGDTVTATVTVFSVRRTESGRATGAVTGDGGSAIVTVPQDVVASLMPLLSIGVQVTVRGTLDTVAGIPTIRVTAVRTVA